MSIEGYLAVSHGSWTLGAPLGMSTDKDRRYHGDTSVDQHVCIHGARHVWTPRWYEYGK